MGDHGRSVVERIADAGVVEVEHADDGRRRAATPTGHQLGLVEVAVDSGAGSLGRPAGGRSEGVSKLLDPRPLRWQDRGEHGAVMQGGGCSTVH